MDNNEVTTNIEELNPYTDEAIQDYGLTEEDLHKLVGKDTDDTVTIEDMNGLIIHMKDMLGIVEQMWMNYKETYSITDEHLKALAAFNAEHCTPKSETDENYDHFNGFDKLTSDDIIRIFGENSLIGKEANEATIKNIKQIVDSYFSWLSGTRQFQQLNNNYINLIEENENLKMGELKKIADAETDPEKKEKMLKAYNEYYAIKYLDFLKEPIDDFRKSIMNQQFVNADKINYLIERTKEKLEEMKFSSMFVLELSNFEKRFLDEKYKDQNNILLLWFLNQVVYGDLKNKEKKDRIKVVTFVLTMDRFIRKQWSAEVNERILNNIIGLEDQMSESITKTLEVYRSTHK